MLTVYSVTTYFTVNSIIGKYADADAIIDKYGIELKYIKTFLSYDDYCLTRDSGNGILNNALIVNETFNSRSLNAHNELKNNIRKFHIDNILA